MRERGSGVSQMLDSSGATSILAACVLLSLAFVWGFGDFWRLFMRSATPVVPGNSWTSPDCTRGAWYVTDVCRILPLAIVVGSARPDVETARAPGSAGCPCPAGAAAGAGVSARSRTGERQSGRAEDALSGAGRLAGVWLP